MMNLNMFCVYHKKYYLREDNKNFIFFGVNEIYPKSNVGNGGETVILEYELEKYNPFLQKRGYMETSVYLHVYWNKLYINKEMVGFSQYDMKHNDNYSQLDNNTIYLLNYGCNIVNNKEWSYVMFPELRNLDFLVFSYNRFFNKNYSMNELEGMPCSLYQTNIYPVLIYEKLCRWLEVLVDEIYPWSNEPPYETHFGNIGGYTERAISIFNAFEIYEGIKYNNLNIYHGIGAFEKEQYNKKSFLNSYCEDIYSKYIDNITGKYEGINFAMFKSQCYFNGILYSCERINKNGKNGLYFTKENEIREYGFDIGGEDPRIFIYMNSVYVLFTCVCSYKHMERGLYITKFDDYSPILLKPDVFNSVEKNWAPLVKNDKLYFIYSFEPLIVLHYDLNPDGRCNIVFKQHDIAMQIYMNNKFLRGGSNFINYKEQYFIGACHSRVHYNGIYYNTHIVLIDTENWEIVYVSKPIMYNTKEGLNKVRDTNIIKHVSILPHHSDNLHNIQAPCSLFIKDEKYYITIDINCHITLLYEILISDLFSLKKELNNIENIVFEYNKFYIENT